MIPPRIDRIHTAEQRREFDHLLDRSSLRDPEALAAIAEYERERRARLSEILTGMPEEQADWEDDAWQREAGT